MKKLTLGKSLLLVGIMIWLIGFVFPGLPYGTRPENPSMWEYAGSITGTIVWPLINSWMLVKYVKSKWIESHIFLSVLIVSFISDFMFNPFLITVILALTMLVSMIGDKFKKKEIPKNNE